MQGRKNEDNAEKIPSPKGLVVYPRQATRLGAGPLVAGTLAVGHRRKINDNDEYG